jgi:hypothetical protein
MRFRLQLWLAETFGLWKHEGLVGFEPHWWPKARVKYPPAPEFDFPGGVSVPMAMGNAVDYAAMFNGTVVPRG